MFAVGFKHSYYPHQWSHLGVRDAHPEIAVLMRFMAFWATQPELPTIPYRSCFQSFTPAERELMRVGVGLFPAGKTLRQHRSEGTTVLVTL
jgi:hypothetical protein